MTTAKDLTDDELIDRIEETYGLRDYGGDVAELVRRYRWREHLVPSAPEKPVATPLRGSTGPLTAADVLGNSSSLPHWYHRWVLTRMKVEKP
jgi:hypothetical protein